MSFASDTLVFASEAVMSYKYPFWFCASIFAFAVSLFDASALNVVTSVNTFPNVSCPSDHVDFSLHVYVLFCVIPSWYVVDL